MNKETRKCEWCGEVSQDVCGCAVATEIRRLQQHLGECSGALELAGHPIAWQARIDAAVAAERERCAARVLPPGWQAIPTTPTPAMMEAFAGVPLEDLSPVKAAREYLAFARMLEVAPKV